MAGYANGLKVLFGQNQFTVTGNPQTVFLALVLDDNFVLRCKQLSAVDSRSTGRRIDWPFIVVSSVGMHHVGLSGKRYFAFVLSFVRLIAG